MTELFNHILRNELTPNQLYVLYCFKNDIQCPLKNVQGEIYILIAAGWLNQNMKLTDKAKNLLNETEALFSKKAKEVSISTLGPDAEARMEEYRQLFPTGANTAHRKPVRTNIKELEPRFVWFFKNYPQYNWDIIMAATRFYIQDSAVKNHVYLQQAKYFICKQEDNSPGIYKSDLATYCDDLEIKDTAA